MQAAALSWSLFVTFSSLVLATQGVPQTSQKAYPAPSHPAAHSTTSVQDLPASSAIRNSTVTTLLKQGVCANAPNARRKAACEQANGLRLGTQPPAPIFKDHQSVISAHVLHELETTPVPEWMSDPYLAPYLYDMDYEILDGHTSVGPQSHLLDPELRMTGMLECDKATDIKCVTPYLPYLYYEDNEYMQGWAMDGLDGEGLRIAIGPNIAPGRNPANYNYTYIPYTERILFAPAASLFFPYLISIYAGEIYVAETSPVLAASAIAARAGIVLDYYYALNYYNPYTFLSIGPAGTADFAAVARVRGVIGTGVKARAFVQSIVTPLRDEYYDHRRQIFLLSDFFAGASAVGGINSNALQRFPFLFSGPNVNRALYPYDYAGSLNPFPLSAAGRRRARMSL